MTMANSGEEPQSRPLSDSSAEIAILVAHGHAEHLSIATHQTQHRISLAEFWGIKEGERVLEIGCGQGDCTAVLAAAVGERGHVTAVDPASLDYGSPMTLGDAQAYLKSSSLGPRITFIQIDPVSQFRDLANKKSEKYDAVILAHSLFYFSSPEQISETLVLAAKHAHKICIAEYALTATLPSAVPHVLAVLTQANLECRKKAETSLSNVRTVLTPARIKEMIRVSTKEMKVLKERVEPPIEGLEDGTWEVAAVKGEEFMLEVDEVISDPREKAVITAMRDSMLENVRLVKERGEKLSTMDVWGASFGIVA